VCDLVTETVPMTMCYTEMVPYVATVREAVCGGMGMPGGWLSGCP
jgi:hypothetical protein